jgi:hypothetical protein
MNLELVESVDADNLIEGDLRLTNHQFTFTVPRSSTAIAQKLRNRLKFFLAEWFLDRRQGLPFYQRILVKNPNSRAIRSIFRQTILTTAGIASVDELQLTINADRTSRLDFRAALDDGSEPLVFSDFILGV